ncbi:MAG: SU10 major capsid protein [Planctomycetota bacterium]
MPPLEGTLTRREEGLQAFQAFDADQILQDLAPDVIIQGTKDTPVLAEIGFTGPKPKNLYHQWTNDDYDVLQVTLNGSVDDSTTTFTITQDGDEIEEGATLEIDDEIVLVTVSAATQLTVTRGQCGTTAAAHDDASICYVIGQATYWNTEFPIAKMKTRTPTGNYSQQWLIPIEVDDVTRLLQNVGTADEFTYQKNKKLPKALQTLERSVLRGRKQSTPQGDATTVGTMDGMRYLITTNSTDASAERLTEATLRAAIKETDDQGGKPDLIICDRFNGDIIDSWNEGRTRYTPDATMTGRSTIQTYRSSYGMQRVIRSRHMVGLGEIYIVDSAKVSLAPIQTFVVVDYSKISTSHRAAIWGIYTLEVKGEKHCAKITNLKQT